MGETSELVAQLRAKGERLRIIKETIANLRTENDVLRAQVGQIIEVLRKTDGLWGDELDQAIKLVALEEGEHEDQA